MGELARHEIDRAHAVGSLWNLLIVIWQATPTALALEGLSRVAEELLMRFPKGIGVVAVASAELPLLAAAERQQGGRLLADHGPRLLGLATVIEGHSVVAGTARGVLTAINMVRKQPCPLKIMGTIDEAAAWMAPLLDDGKQHRPTSSTLRHAIEGLRRELDAHQTPKSN